MNRKNVLLLFSVLALVFVSVSSFSPGNVSLKPNIILVVADDLGWGDVGYHGSNIGTPNINRFVKEGVSLERFYVSPSCTPSRVSLLTGCYAGRYGLQTGVITPKRRDGLPTDATVIADVLAEAGYADRACIGKWHLGHSNVKYHPLRRGFNYFYGHFGGMVDYFTHRRAGELDWHRNYESNYDEGYTTHLLATEAVRFLEKAKKDDPFFLYVAFNAPHTPLQGTNADLDQNSFVFEKGLFSGDNPLKGDDSGKMLKERHALHYGQGNSRRQTYAAMVTSLDKSFGRILTALEKTGLRENTLVLFVSDNGADISNGGLNLPLRGQKGKLYEGGVKVPAAMQWPAQLEAGKTVTDMVAHIDVLPTIAEIVQGKRFDGKNYDGLSVLGLLPFKSAELQTTEVGPRLLYLGKDGLVTNRWKLVYDELYDIVSDPYETKNIAEEFPRLKESLLDSLKHFRNSICVFPARDESFTISPEWKMPED